MPVDTLDFGAAFDRIEQAVASEYGVVGAEMYAELVGIMSIPVGRVRVGRRQVIVRSLPGEAPRKEFGELVASLDFDAVRLEGSGAILSLFSTSMVSVYLTEGTSTIAPRPHWSRIIDSWSGQILPRTAAAVSGA